MSNEKHPDNISFWHATRKIILSYCVATLIYCVVMFKFFDLATYLRFLISFNISGPLYFVLLYLQLMLVNKFLFPLVKESGIIKDMGFMLLVIFISYLTTNFTNVLDVYGGGRKLFGGTYLILFFCGMILEKYHVFTQLKWQSVVFKIVEVVVSMSGAVVWWRFECRNCFGLDNKLPFGAGLNPPSISSMTMAFIMLFLTWAFFTLLETNKYGATVVQVFSWLGKNTLYIFLYHRLFLDYLLVPYIQIRNIYLKAFVYYAIMLLGPIGIKSCLDKGKKLLQYRKSDVKKI